MTAPRPKLIEYAPGQYGYLVREAGDFQSFETCTHCGKDLGYAGVAERAGDRAKVHYMRAYNRPGYILDCKTERFFRSEFA